MLSNCFGDVRFAKLIMLLGECTKSPMGVAFQYPVRVEWLLKHDGLAAALTSVTIANR